jgi:hypothetical protein
MKAGSISDGKSNNPDETGSHHNDHEKSGTWAMTSRGPDRPDVAWERSRGEDDNLQS